MNNENMKIMKTLWQIDMFCIYFKKNLIKVFKKACAGYFYVLLQASFVVQ